MEPGGEGEEAVGGDAQLGHHVTVEGEGEEGLHQLRPHHQVWQTWGKKHNFKFVEDTFS